MSQLIRYPRAPQCFSCIRSILTGKSPLALSPFRTQIRGKKKKVKLPLTINVKLLKDVRGYGRKGAIVPVMPGRMRNIWYPSKRAEYMTSAILKTMPDVVIERDFTFGMDRVVEVKAAKKAAAAPVQTKLLTPQRITQILSQTIPTYLDFYRPLIFTPEPSTPAPAPRTSTDSISAAAADLAAAFEPLPQPKPQNTAIYGSVSTADIVTVMQAALNVESLEDEDALLVVLSADDINIVQEEGKEGVGEVDRIKSVGEFMVEIQVRGGEPVRRIVRVMAQGKPGLRL
ncbi:hypothetical protein MMC30_007458 [Trapelia coarctata]|nr:hypothetical protein [Trapelia coarctata]